MLRYKKMEDKVISYIRRRRDGKGWKPSTEHGTIEFMKRVMRAKEAENTYFVLIQTLKKRPHSVTPQNPRGKKQRKLRNMSHEKKQRRDAQDQSERNILSMQTGTRADRVKLQFADLQKTKRKTLD